MVERIMSMEDARRVYNDILSKLDVVDLDKLCGKDETENADVDNLSISEAFEKKLVQSISCGLVYWNDEENCVTQKLVKPVEGSGSCVDVLHYKNPVTLSMQRYIVEQDRVGLISRLVGRGTSVIGNLQAFDATVAAMIVKNFFGA